jgi:signal-transduction protein with cAMP-binding, CBS, and nucleotidyltransferase domain
VHTITVPLKIMKQLTENHFTTVGTDQFIQDTRLMTVRVKEALNGINPIVEANTTLTESIVKMTEFGFGAITVVNNDGSLKGVFTDGDLRRKLTTDGRDVLSKSMSDFTYNAAISVEGSALLNEAAGIFKSTKVDTILVVSLYKFTKMSAIPII